MKIPNPLHNKAFLNGLAETIAPMVADMVAERIKPVPPPLTPGRGDGSRRTKAGYHANRPNALMRPAFRKDGSVGTIRVHAKLNPEKVRVIKQRLMSGETVGNLAREHDVCYTTILSIQKGKTWKDVIP